MKLVGISEGRWSTAATIKDEGWHHTPPAHCEHIHAYYHHLWVDHPCIAFNLLRRGYRQWAEGYVDTFNNLYEDHDAPKGGIQEL